MSHLLQSYYDVSKLVIWGEAELNAKRPRLVFGFRDGNPRITVYTGEEGANGVISFPTDYPSMATIATIIRDVANGSNEDKVSIDALVTKYENNTPLKEKRLLSTFYIGKSKEGIVYFCLFSDNKPKHVFPIKPSDFHVFRDSGKNIISSEIISKKMAIGISDILLNIISSVILSYTNEELDAGLKKSVKIKGREQPAHDSNPPTTTIEELDI